MKNKLIYRVDMLNLWTKRIINLIRFIGIIGFILVVLENFTFIYPIFITLSCCFLVGSSFILFVLLAIYYRLTSKEEYRKNYYNQGYNNSKINNNEQT